MKPSLNHLSISHCSFCWILRIEIATIVELTVYTKDIGVFVVKTGMAEVEDDKKKNIDTKKPFFKHDGQRRGYAIEDPEVLDMFLEKTESDDEKKREDDTELDEKNKQLLTKVLCSMKK